MIEELETEIGGFKYKLEQLGAKQSTKVFVRLCHMLGPALEGMKGVDEAALLSGLGNVLANAKEDDIEYLLDSFAKRCRVRLTEDKWPLVSDVFDVHFARRFGDQMHWLIWCVRGNFGDFLGEIIDAAASKSSTIQASRASSSPNT